jgi:toxin ParE1/3/4
LNAQLSFEDLAEQPAMGAPVRVRAPELAELRKWRVREFESVLIFYLPRRSGISILRVLHATQDWWQLLGLDDP